MKVVTAEQIREMDRRAMSEYGIPGAVLMENAGRAVVEVMAREYGPLRGKRVAVFCGGGNNGGDGFVIARYLYLAGAEISFYLIDPPEKLKADAKVHFELIRRLGIPVRRIDYIQDLLGQVRQDLLVQMAPQLSRLRKRMEERAVSSSLAEGAASLRLPYDPEAYTDQMLLEILQALLTGCDLIVDALLGTGIREAPRYQYAQAIEAINGAGRPVIAVDVPSGVDSDTGATPGAAVRATHTVTFAYPKLGCYLYPGAECVGTLHVTDIGFDWERLKVKTGFRLFALPRRSHYGPEVESAPSSADLPGLRTAARLLKMRPPDSNKGMYGHVAVVAGSQGMVGAPALVARAAQRSGAGLVTVLAPACAQPAIAAKLDEQMTLPLPDADGAASEDAFDTIAAFAEKAAVICIGPGMTQKPGAAALVRRMLAELRLPIVLDADGLNALAQHPDCIDARPNDPRAPLVLTPHPGEAARLLGVSIADVQGDRVWAVCELARRFRAVALLKGRFTLIADPTGEIVINTTGNPGMATGGSGDVLTGVVGALMAQGVAPGRDIEDEKAWRAQTVGPQDAVALSAYLHGLAGDLAAAQIGEAGLTAGDLIACLPQALRQLEETR